MKEFTFEYVDPMLPVDFFSVQLEIPYVKGFSSSKWFREIPLLPDMTPYLGEDKFADLALGWNEEGLLGELIANKEFEESVFPRYEEGDSLELFIDTRDIKQAGFATKFCHHFVFLIQEVQGIKAQEMTKFRSDDSHPLCDAELLMSEVKFGKKEYQMQFHIPSSCLFGYDPASFQRLGFTYKINRPKAPSQHFSVSSKYYDVLQHPSSWSSLKIIHRS